MFTYYREAHTCYVYLQDLPATCPPLKDARCPQRWLSSFKACRWFQRGWTLQELLASKQIEFYNADWIFVGNLNDVVASVAQRTRIEATVLLKARGLEDVSIAQRMSWAAGRRTTRVEDRAYSMLGIFNIHMPLLYGEGTNAFKRLQEEILKKTGDQTLLAWGYRKHWALGMPLGLFAESPDDFETCDTLVPGNLHSIRESAVELNNVGMHIHLLMITVNNYYFGVLNCKLRIDSDLYMALYLERSDHEAPSDDVFNIVDASAVGGEHPWRLYVVDVAQRLPYATRTQALLLNHDIRVDLDFTWEHLPLWIQIDTGCSLEIIDAFPDSQWNFASGTMTPGRTAGLDPGFGGRQNFTAVVLRDREVPHHEKTLCFGFASNNRDVSVAWAGFVEEPEAQQACARLASDIEECLQTNQAHPQGTKLWPLAHRTIKIEERDPLGSYRVFGLSLERGVQTSPRPSDVPLLLRFGFQDAAASVPDQPGEPDSLD